MPATTNRPTPCLPMNPLLCFPARIRTLLCCVHFDTSITHIYHSNTSTFRLRNLTENQKNNKKVQVLQHTGLFEAVTIQIFKPFMKLYGCCVDINDVYMTSKPLCVVLYCSFLLHIS